MNYILTVFGILLGLSVSAQNNMTKYSAKILLIPLDDRPPCLQFTQKMGLIGNAEVIAPPKDLLGNFTAPGQSAKIITWLKQQDLKTFDAAIFSLDMLAYGGLVASRVYNISAEKALNRIAILKDIRKMSPSLPIYVQSVIMRLAPTGDGKNEAYRAKLAEWAEISVSTDESSKTQTAKLEQEIPAVALLNYKQSRTRNLAINLKAIDYVKNGVVDYLILSQDDAKPKGIHISDRERLVAEVKQLNLTDKILVQPGADEISMLLLSRALNKKFNFSPKIKAIYSSLVLSTKPMPFEDRPLRQTVSYDIQAIGGKEVEDAEQADLLFYIYASRFEAGRAKSFAQEIEEKVNQNRHLIVADIDPRGDVQGGDTNFSMELLSRNLFPRLFSYASWNTAGNTIGTTLPQGSIFALSTSKLSATPLIEKRIQVAENWFTFHRVLDDYYYHNLVRAQAKDFIAKNNWDPYHLSNEATQKVEKFCLNLLNIHFKELSNHYFSKKLADLTFTLPWNRTFEAEINFNLKAGKN
jgi:hypothetical protein